YEAGALADRLTEQAGDGWSVVAIVPTGSTITAYLSRDGGGASSTDSTSSVPTTSASPMESGHDDHGSSDHDADDGPSIPATTTGTLTGHDTAAADPVSEAPGWASGSGGGGGAAGSDEPVGSMPQTESTPTASTPTESAGAAAGAAPAGWYADPSSRFELRYWDGGQWTEHVSRSGQQYTDPPVA
ncbi:MAG: DUF2510 domain-containing protein, partial [Ilumatobacter sp.]